MVGYRLVRERRAADAFSGEGARHFGGRWNPKNSPTVYGSEHLSLAVLEFRVNQGGMIRKTCTFTSGLSSIRR